MEVGDLVKAMDRDAQEYGIITEIIQVNFAVRWIIVMLFNGTEKHYHPTRVMVVQKETPL